MKGSHALVAFTLEIPQLDRPVITPSFNQCLRDWPHSGSGGGVRVIGTRCKPGLSLKHLQDSNWPCVAHQALGSHPEFVMSVRLASSLQLGHLRLPPRWHHSGHCRQRQSVQPPRQIKRRAGTFKSRLVAVLFPQLDVVCSPIGLRLNGHQVCELTGESVCMVSQPRQQSAVPGSLTTSVQSTAKQPNGVPRLSAELVEHALDSLYTCSQRTADRSWPSTPPRRRTLSERDASR
jgi:hypothetical protein